MIRVSQPGTKHQMNGARAEEMQGPGLYLLLATAAVSGEFHLQTQDTTQVAAVGSHTFLPCTLASPQSLSELRLHWFRSLYHSTIFLLDAGKENKEQQSPEYSGRTSLRSNPESGDLTLELHNVSLSDADTYHCLVENITSKRYKEAVTDLTVIGLGSVPVLGVSLEDDSIAISFDTSDWFPLPVMRWTINGGKVETYDLEIRNQTNGLYQVRSRILLNRSSDGHVYGAVRHPVTGKEVGVHMEIADDVFPRLSSWLFAFVFILVILTAGAIFSSFYLWKQKSQREELTRTIGDLASEVAWRAAVMTPEYVTLCPETAHPELSVSSDLTTLINEPPGGDPVPSNSRFETERSCLGLPAFSSGCHYWEVELGGCLEWAVGVASPEVRRRGHAYMFSPEEHIWCISRFMQDFKALDTPEASLPEGVAQMDRVGVYLNLSRSREITFYNPRNWEKLYTFTNVGRTSGTVLPFFWLGKNGNRVKLTSRDKR